MMVMAVLSVQRNGDWNNPYTLWKAAAERAPEEVRAYVHMGNYLRDADDLSGAVGNFERALTLQPGNVAAANNLGNAYRLMGDWRKAVEVYERLLGEHPDLVDVRYNMARSLQDGGESQGALPLYLSVDRSSFHYDLALNNAGTIHEQAGHLDSALVYYGKALAAKPTSVQAEANWMRISRDFEYHGDRLQEGRDYVQLESAARLLLGREKSHRAARFWLAASLFGQARYSQAIVQFQLLVRQHPDFGPGHLQLANSLQTSGRLEEAVQAYRDLLESNADAENVSTGVERMGLLLERME